jgi:group I intron endonuclease
MKRYGSIYKITNLLNNKIYIGQTVGSVSARFNVHFTNFRSITHIGNTMRKYGRENFKIDELFIAFDLESLNNAEQVLINQFNSLSPNGYNLRPGGCQYGHLSDETKKKISSSKTGKPNFKKRGEKRDDSYRLKISQGLGGKPIISIDEETNNKTIYLTAHETTKYGFQPWNVVACCKGKRVRHKNHKFYYLNDYANQSGSVENKISSHAQRLEIETAKAE